MLEDRQPIVLIHGLRVSEEVLAITREVGYSSERELLDDTDGQYDDMVKQRRPEEILID